MKKKIIIPIIICLIIVIGIIGFIVWNNNRVVSTITLDINPSIEINLKRNNKVKRIVALNDAAKSIITKEYNNKTLDESFDLLVKNLVDKGFVEDHDIDIIIYSEGKIKNKDVIAKVDLSFEKKGIHTDVIVIDKVTKEDKELAKKYKISPAKVSYINSITKENGNINKDLLADKSVKELNDMKRTGNYCDVGYILDNDKCLKEINRVNASVGKICPGGYDEYNGICYQVGGFRSTGEYKCSDNKELSGNECIETTVRNAVPEYSCSKGELMKKGDVDPIGSSVPNETVYCVDKSTGKPPKLRCLNNSGHIMIDGKCYNGPAPTINGGCPNGDLLRNGSCYSKDNEDQYQCPNGNIYEKSKGTYVDLCPDTLTYTKPTINGYRCDDERAQLNNDKCVLVEKSEAEEIYECEEGFTLIGNDKCLNYNNTTPKENGFVCEGENTRAKGNMCIIYEVVEAKHN